MRNYDKHFLGYLLKIYIKDENYINQHVNLYNYL